VMQERQVTIGRETHKVPNPFLVLATQNPIETEGTYALPEAQVDRFMLKLRVRYPSYSEERKITERQVMDEEPEVKAVFSPKEILDLRHYIAKRTPLRDDSPIVKYSTRIVRATRPEEGTDGFIKGLALYGASPRASISLAKAARAYSFIKGDDTVLPEHVQAMAYPVLRHRIILTHEAESRGVDPDEVIRDVLESVPRFE